MALSEGLRQPIKGMPPISEEEADRLASKAHEAVGGKLTARPGEDHGSLDALQAMRELQEYRILATAQQIGDGIEAWAHERDVVIPAEELFAQQHGLTADDLEVAWGKRRDGIRGKLFRDETEERAALRDQFYSLVDTIGAEMIGEEYEYGQFIAGISTEGLVELVQTRLDRQNQG